MKKKKKTVVPEGSHRRDSVEAIFSKWVTINERLREELKRRIIHEQFHTKNKSLEEAIEFADIEIKRIEEGIEKEKAHDRRN